MTLFSTILLKVGLAFEFYCKIICNAKFFVVLESAMELMGKTSTIKICYNIKFLHLSLDVILPAIKVLFYLIQVFIIKQKHLFY